MFRFTIRDVPQLTVVVGSLVFASPAGRRWVHALR